MPPVTRWFVKTSLIYLIAALLAGVILAAGALGADWPFINGLTPVYFHLFMVGWVLQMIIGIVFWLFPKHSKARPRGYEWLAWTTYALLNAGLLLRAAGEPLLAQTPGGKWGWLLAASALLQWLAGVCFVINTWPRVRGRLGKRQ